MKHILVVDDEAPIRDLLSEYFRKRGYKVSTAATPAEAISLADGVPLNLVVLDLLLDDTDGMEVLETMKKSGEPLAIVVDEYGDFDGIVTLHDILQAYGVGQS